MGTFVPQFYLQQTLTVTGTNATVSGVIGPGAGPGGLIKAGEATLTLTGANTFRGTASVFEGTLALAGSGSLASSRIEVVTGNPLVPSTLDVSGVTGGFTLAAGKTLAVAGIDQFGITLPATVVTGSQPFTAASGSRVEAGFQGDPGAATFDQNGAVVFAPGSTLGLILIGSNSSADAAPDSGDSGDDNTTNSTLAFIGSGAVTFGGIFEIDGSDFSGGLVVGQQYSYVVGTAPTPTTPVSITDPSRFRTIGFTATNFSFNYIGNGMGGGNLFLNFTPTPEPATALGLAAVALGVAGRVRRRWR